MSKLDEQVLVFESHILKDLGYFQGLTLNANLYFNATVKGKNTFFLERVIAEESPKYKQIIPYCIITDGNKILRYRRGKRGSEERLRELYSIGIGGHINRTEALFEDDVYYLGVRREVRQEINLDLSEKYLVPVAAINDDSNSVGQVHFGFVHVIKVDSLDNISFQKEDVITYLRSVTIDMLLKDIDSYENWSQICIKNINELIN